jgi:hypothetical protein
MRKYLILLSFVALAKSSFSQLAKPQSKQELIAACDKFMDMFKDAQFRQAFNFIKHYSVIEDSKLDTLGMTVAHQMGAIRNGYGRIVGYERVSAREIKNSVVKLVYIIKLEKTFLQCRFILYSPGGATGWTINNFKYNEEMDELNFEEPKRP